MSYRVEARETDTGLTEVYVTASAYLTARLALLVDEKLGWGRTEALSGLVERLHRDAEERFEAAKADPETNEGPPG